MATVLFGPIEKVGKKWVYETYVIGEGRVTHPYDYKEIAHTQRQYAIKGIEVAAPVYSARVFDNRDGFEGAIEHLRELHTRRQADARRTRFATR